MLSANDYGTMLMIIGIMNAVGVAFGNPLNNTRLLLDKVYRSSGVSGDFPKIARICGILSILVVGTIVFAVFPQYEWYYYLSISITAGLVYARSYYSVAFRLDLNYQHILFASLAGLIGCFFGLAINHFIKFWPIVFLAMEITQFAYIARNSYVWAERGGRTLHAVRTRQKFQTLAFAGLISAGMPYIDRFIVYPMLGAADVAIFVVSTYLGKIVGGIAVPVAGVLLSHDVKSTGSRRLDVWKRFATVTFICVAVYFLIVLLDEHILHLLFPSLAEAASPYVSLATAATMIGALATLVNPSVLRYSATYFQVLIQVLHLAVLVLFGVLAVLQWGLYGFCWALMIANSVKLLVMMIVVSYKFDNK